MTILLRGHQTLLFVHKSSGLKLNFPVQHCQVDKRKLALIVVAQEGLTFNPPPTPLCEKRSNLTKTRNENKYLLHCYSTIISRWVVK